MPSEPPFAEPWQAGALALAEALVAAGHVSRTDWAEALGAEIAAAREAGGPEDGSNYYPCVLAAVERLVAERGLATPETLAARRDDWHRAYAETPHGAPVRL